MVFVLSTVVSVTMSTLRQNTAKVVNIMIASAKCQSAP